MRQVRPQTANRKEGSLLRWDWYWHFYWGWRWERWARGSSFLLSRRSTPGCVKGYRKLAEVSGALARDRFDCVDLPRLCGHPAKHESGLGVGDGETRRGQAAEYKAAVVRLVRDRGKSIGVIALELGLGETALRRWGSKP
jgi:hypothetical protein